MHHFHHDNGFANTGPAKHTHFAPPRKGNQQVDNLNTGLENAYRGILLGKLGRFTVDGQHFFLAHWTQSINGSADHVENASQAGFANRHHNGFLSVFNRHPPNQTVGDVHGDGPDHIITQMLGHFYH